MFTDCPDCHRQFRIRAQQLSAARGLVKCGYCGKQFNALDRLHDSPLTTGESRITQPPATPSPPTTEAATAEAPMAEVFERHDEVALASAEDRETAEPEEGMEKMEIMEDIESSESEPLPTDIEPSPQQTDEDVIFPEALMDDLTDKPGGRSKTLWTVCVLLLLIIGIAQVAWFNRDAVLRRYPALTPWVKQLCEQLQCKVIRWRDVSAIKLVNRDVREHPRYRNTLLVNATIANRSRAAQPFPRVQLTLFDTNGKMIAHRTFEPGDYLDDSINLSMGMDPDLPVHFVLEVTAPPKGAESFEFKFL